MELSAKTESEVSPSAIAFINNSADIPNATLLDFWRWAFSDMCDDDLEGIFAAAANASQKRASYLPSKVRFLWTARATGGRSGKGWSSSAVSSRDSMFSASRLRQTRTRGMRGTWRSGSSI
jgi:hypothetical protein